MPSNPQELWLENQMCFPLYALSRMVTKLYTPLLEKLDITYPQYLVFLVLWQHGTSSVSEISQQLFLESNTLTPLLKRLESKGFLVRQRATDDERRVMVSLTSEGKALEAEALCIPQEILGSFHSDNISPEEAHQFRDTLHKLMGVLAGEAKKD